MTDNLDQDQLIRIATGKPDKGMNRATLIAWLRKNRIDFKYTADEKRVWTTQHQIEKAFNKKLEVVRIGKEA